MLLDELFSQRERAQALTTPTPVLTVDPVAVPSTIETGRRAVRQRLVELESAARRNFRSAEEARRVLAEEHERLQQEATARTEAQQEAAALRREIDRLSSEEARRSAQERTRAERAARAEIADELRRFQEEHQRVVQEMSGLRSSLTEHDGLLDEYVTRLREEQTARAALRAELDRAEAARSLAERSLQRATENARHGAEDEMIRLATAEQELADARSDRDRFRAQLDELTSGDGAIGQMTAQLEDKEAEIVRLGIRIADLGARIDASEDAAREALRERDDAVAARVDVEARLQLAEQARADAELAVDVATARIAEVEAELAERISSTDTRARELDKTLGKLRREARDASGARRAAEGELATADAEREQLRAQVAELSAESVRARADGDRLRAHAVMLGDELAAARAAVAELQAAASAPPLPALHPRLEESFEESSGHARGAPPAPAPAPALAPQTRVEESSKESPTRSAQGVPPTADGVETLDAPPPLPLRIAGRHAPATPLARRRPRRDAPAPAVAAAAPEAATAPVAEAEPEAAAPEAQPPAPPVADGAFRRTALAEFTALASSSGDDFTFRRR